MKDIMADIIIGLPILLFSLGVSGMMGVFIICGLRKMWRDLK